MICLVCDVPIAIQKKIRRDAVLFAQQQIDEGKAFIKEFDDLVTCYIHAVLDDLEAGWGEYTW